MGGSGSRGQAPPDDRSGELSRVEFARLFDRAARSLWLIAVAIVRDRASADDVVQDAALVAIEKLSQFRAGSSFHAWMGQIVRHVALNYSRREKRRRAAGGAQDASDRPASEPSGPPSGELATAQWGTASADELGFDDQLMRALGELNNAARACLLLRTLGGLEYSEISRLLGIPSGTAMSYVHRSRRYLRQRLTEEMDVPADSTGSEDA